MERSFERTGMWANLGARVVEKGEGRVVVEARLNPEAHGFPTPRGTIAHGGAIAALADMALAAAGGSLGDGPLATVDLKIDFLRPGRPGRMLARAEVRRRTRRLCFAAATIEEPEGDGPVAEARAVLAYLDPVSRGGRRD